MVERLSAKSALVAGALVFFVVLLAGWFLLVAPKRSEAADLQAQVEATQATLEIDKALLRGSKKQAALSARLTKAMPPDARMPGILRELSTLSQIAGVKLNSITPGPPTPTGTYNTLPLSVTLEGRYFSIAQFLHLLNARADVAGTKVTGEGRLYSVPQLQLASGVVGGLLQGTLTINGYTFAGAPTTPAPTAPITTTPESSSVATATP